MSVPVWVKGSTSRRSRWPRPARASPPPPGPRPSCALLVLRVPALRGPHRHQPDGQHLGPGARKLRTEVYSDAEADLMLAWAGDQPGKRGRVGYAVLATLRWTGLRRNEISMLRLDDVDLDARRISLVGKGDKARVVPIAPPLVPILDDYLTSLRPAPRSRPSCFVNPSAQRRRALRGTLRPDDGGKLVQRAGTGAGVTGRHFPHRWRHSYATSLLRRGVDIHVVQRLPRPFQHRHDDAVPAPLRRRPHRRRGQGVPRRVATPPAASRGSISSSSSSAVR